MEQDRPESKTGFVAGMRARWEALDPALRRRILWIATMVVIVLIVVAVFALGFAGKCRFCSV